MENNVNFFNTAAILFYVACVLMLFGAIFMQNYIAIGLVLVIGLIYYLYRSDAVTHARVVDNFTKQRAQYSKEIASLQERIDFLRVDRARFAQLLEEEKAKNAKLQQETAAKKTARSKKKVSDIKKEVKALLSYNLEPKEEK